jgi:hypothetical protein
VATYAFNSAALFDIARTARDRAVTNPVETVVTVVFAVAGLESFVNELLERLRFDSHQPSVELERACAIAEAGNLYERTASLPLKVQLLSVALSGVQMDQGAQPYQDFDLLLAIRNVVAHQRPERLPDTGGAPVESQHILKRLVARGLLLSLPSADTIHTTFGGITDPAVASWALEAALRMVRAVGELLPAPVAARALMSYRGIKLIDQGSCRLTSA